MNYNLIYAALLAVCGFHVSVQATEENNKTSDKIHVSVSANFQIERGKSVQASAAFEFLFEPNNSEIELLKSTSEKISVDGKRYDPKLLSLKPQWIRQRLPEDWSVYSKSMLYVPLLRKIEENYEFTLQIPQCYSLTSINYGVEDYDGGAMPQTHIEGSLSFSNGGYYFKRAQSHSNIIGLLSTAKEIAINIEVGDEGINKGIVTSVSYHAS